MKGNLCDLVTEAIKNSSSPVHEDKVRAIQFLEDFKNVDHINDLLSLLEVPGVSCEVIFFVCQVLSLKMECYDFSVRRCIKVRLFGYLRGVLNIPDWGVSRILSVFIALIKAEYSHDIVSNNDDLFMDIVQLCTKSPPSTESSTYFNGLLLNLMIQLDSDVLRNEISSQDGDQRELATRIKDHLRGFDNGSILVRIFSMIIDLLKSSSPLSINCLIVIRDMAVWAPSELLFSHGLWHYFGATVQDDSTYNNRKLLDIILLSISHIIHKRMPLVQRQYFLKSMNVGELVSYAFQKMNGNYTIDVIRSLNMLVCDLVSGDHDGISFELEANANEYIQYNLNSDDVKRLYETFIVLLFNVLNHAIPFSSETMNANSYIFTIELSEGTYRMLRYLWKCEDPGRDNAIKVLLQTFGERLLASNSINLHAVTDTVLDDTTVFMNNTHYDDSEESQWLVCRNNILNRDISRLLSISLLGHGTILYREYITHIINAADVSIRHRDYNVFQMILSLTPSLIDSFTDYSTVSKGVHNYDRDTKELGPLLELHGSLIGTCCNIDHDFLVEMTPWCIYTLIGFTGKVAQLAHGSQDNNVRSVVGMMRSYYKQKIDLGSMTRLVFQLLRSIFYNSGQSSTGSRTSQNLLKSRLGGVAFRSLSSLLKVSPTGLSFHESAWMFEFLRIKPLNPIVSYMSKGTISTVSRDALLKNPVSYVKYDKLLVNESCLSVSDQLKGSECIFMNSDNDALMQTAMVQFIEVCPLDGENEVSIEFHTRVCQLLIHVLHNSGRSMIKGNRSEAYIAWAAYFESSCAAISNSLWPTWLDSLLVIGNWFLTIAITNDCQIAAKCVKTLIHTVIWRIDRILAYSGLPIPECPIFSHDKSVIASLSDKILLLVDLILTKSSSLSVLLFQGPPYLIRDLAELSSIVRDAGYQARILTLIQLVANIAINYTSYALINILSESNVCSIRNNPDLVSSDIMSLLSFGFYYDTPANSLKMRSTVVDAICTLYFVCSMGPDKLCSYINSTIPSANAQPNDLDLSISDQLTRFSLLNLDIVKLMQGMFTILKGSKNRKLSERVFEHFSCYLRAIIVGTHSRFNSVVLPMTESRNAMLASLQAQFGKERLDVLAETLSRASSSKELARSFLYSFPEFSNI